MCDLEERIQQLEDSNHILRNTLNDIWALLYGLDSEVEWDYPGQVASHMRVELQWFEDLCKAIEADGLVTPSPLLPLLNKLKSGREKRAAILENGWKR